MASTFTESNPSNSSNLSNLNYLLVLAEPRPRSPHSRACESGRRRLGLARPQAFKRQTKMSTRAPGPG
jgi:hypothetical protein